MRKCCSNLVDEAPNFPFLLSSSINPNPVTSIEESVEQAEDPCNRRRRRQLRPSQTRSCETREECHQRIRAQVQERTARVSKERAQVDKAK